MMIVELLIVIGAAVELFPEFFFLGVFAHVVEGCGGGGGEGGFEQVHRLFIIMIWLNR